jgi:uncharacterized protein YcbK (DUF882 family)
LALTAAIVAVLASGKASHLTAALGDTRTLSFFNIHTKESTTVLFKKDGKVVPGAYDKLNWVLRDWRANEKTTMDPGLFDLIWDIYTELGSKEPIHIVSAYRSRGTNDMLRRTTGGQASESRHILGKAIDVHFPDVELKKLRYSALIREQGGVGYYPTSALPFVHIDTDRVRHWPRLPRYELALLFPNGKSQHQPADGGPITGEDVKVAQGRYRELSQQVAAYHGFRREPKVPVAVADAAAVGPIAPGRTAVAAKSPPPLVVAAATPPQLQDSPRVVDRPSRLTGPSASDRMKLTELMQLAAAMPEPKLIAAPQPARRPQAQVAPSLSGAQIAPPLVASARPAAQVAAIAPSADAASAVMTDARAGFGNGFAISPAFDEEHPDELSYRPFPIAPLLTLTSSADDPVLVNLQHPDVAKTIDLLDQAGSLPPMRLRPPARTAALMLAQQFKGDAVSVGTFSDPEEGSATAIPASRKVATTR